MHRKVCIQILRSESLANKGESAGRGHEGEINNLNMYIHTILEHYHYIVLLLFFPLVQAQVCWYVCAEVTLLQQRTSGPSLVLQSQRLLLTVNG